MYFPTVLPTNGRNDKVKRIVKLELKENSYNIKPLQKKLYGHCTKIGKKIEICT